MILFVTLLPVDATLVRNKLPGVSAIIINGDCFTLLGSRQSIMETVCAKNHRTFLFITETVVEGEEVEKVVEIEEQDDSDPGHGKQ